MFADRGYFKGEQILKCEQAGINALVPKPQTSNNKAAGLFDKADFRYIPSKDEYRCPAGQRAIWRFTTVEHGITIHKYWSSACPRCPIKSQCTTGEYRRIARLEHEMYSTRCKSALAAHRRRREYADGPLSIPSAPSRRGWGDPLPHQNDPAGEYRDELACTRIQPETCNASCRDRTADASDKGLNALFYADCTTLIPVYQTIHTLSGTRAPQSIAFSHSLGRNP